MTTNKDRAEFEAWATRNGLPTARQPDGYYADAFVRENYTGWQAASSRSGAVPAVTEVPTDAEGFADTGDKEADSIINRLNSSDPTFDDCALAVAWIWRKAQDVPQDYPSWQAAAFAERMRRRELEKQLAAAPEPPQGDPRDSGCLCSGCGTRYRGDLLVPDDVWERIKPAGSSAGGGLLCPNCIMQRVVDLGVWTAARATDIEAPRSGDAPVAAQLYNALSSTVAAIRAANVLQNRDYDGIGAQANAALRAYEYLRDTAPPADARDGEIAALRAFANDVIGEREQFDPDIQELAEQHGLLALVTVTESCGENCECAEVGFPAECYRKTSILKSTDRAMGAGGGK